jgi:hypothetical protein
VTSPATAAPASPAAAKPAEAAKPAAPAKPADVPIEQFVGQWTNVDAETRGLTKVEVSRLGASSLIVRAYGKCHPTDCDWGAVQLPYAGSPIIVPYKFSFKLSNLTVSPQGERLVVSVDDRYTDQSGRPDRVSSYTFARR